MKILDKITLIIYSNIILITSIVLILAVAGVIDISIIGDTIENIIAHETGSKIVLGVSIIFILMSFKAVFFDKGKKKEKQGILLENESGKLLISKETIENLVNSVAINFESAEEVSTKIQLDPQNNVRVFVSVSVSPEAVIKDLSANLQTKIKEKVKTATDLDVKEVTISVKKVAAKKVEITE